MKTKTILINLLTCLLISVNYQNTHSQNNEISKLSKTDNLNNKDYTLLDVLTPPLILKAFAYVATDLTGGLPQCPCSFNLNTPGSITSLAPGTSSNFIAAGTWAKGKWYAEEWGVGNLYTIDTADEAMNFIGSAILNISGLAYDGTTMFACTGSNFYSINLTNGSATFIGPMGNYQFMVGMASDYEGNFYGVDIYDDNLYSIDPITGSAIVIGPLGIDISYAQDLEFDKNNDVLYLAGLVNTEGALYTLNTETGSASLVGNFMNSCEIDGFTIPYGNSLLTHDIGIISIIAPNSGVGLNEEDLTVLIKNFGSAPQTDFEITYTLDNQLPVTETINTLINCEDTLEYTFSSPANLLAFGSHLIEVCTSLANDENPEDDCFSKTIINAEPSYYCNASTFNNSGEWIANVTCGSINNSTGWQGEVGDYTNLLTTMMAGMNESITVTNGDPYPNDSVTVWIDWDENYIFEMNSQEEYKLNHDGNGEIFSGAIEIPMGTVGGEYRMRVRLVHAENPNPCGPADWGEIEDYTIVIDNATNICTSPSGKIEIFPNPTSKYVYLCSEFNVQSITLFTQTGQLVFNEILSGNSFEIDVSNLESGIYQLIIETNRESIFRKLIKK